MRIGMYVRMYEKISVVGWETMFFSVLCCVGTVHYDGPSRWFVRFDLCGLLLGYRMVGFDEGGV